MTEAALHRGVVLGVLVAALPTLRVLWFRTAPYGRHARAGYARISVVMAIAF